MGKQKKILTRTIIVVSAISLLTDISSEMLYPVMPLYLRHIGFSIAYIGLLEGMAEAVAGLSKGFFGKWSDRLGSRAPFISVGYGLSAISKPMMALLIFPLWIFFARFTDRLGKGVRTAARDAMLSDESLPENKAKVFGFHRAMDTVGAAIGPVLALCYLWYRPGDYRAMFLLAFLPAIAGVGLTFLLKDKKVQQKPMLPPGEHISVLSYLKYWKVASPAYRRLVIFLLIFALLNSSDAFLLLMMKEQGMSDRLLISVYIFYNLIYALAAYPLGILADRLGMKRIFISGLFLFALVYLVFPLAHALWIFILLFIAYGLYAAATEGVAKAWLTNLCHRSDTATAIGFYTSLGSVAALVASTLAGLLWYAFGPWLPFLVSGAGTLVLVIFLAFAPFHRLAEGNHAE